MENMSRNLKRALFLALLAVAMPVLSFAQVVVSITVAPPVIPVYEQPVCPEPGLLWTPGYWAYGEAGYFWVPGVWVQPPSVGLLWTPGYWAFEGPVYIWHAGYWGPHVGFYGGVNYGFGYTGVGFLGGVWAGSVFRYNTAVMHVGVGFHDVYVDRAAVVEGGVRVSFNGRGGVAARPTAAERIAERDHHIEHTELQRSHEHAASLDRSARFSENHGRPSHAATARAGERRAENHAGRGPAERPAAESIVQPPSIVQPSTHPLAGRAHITLPHTPRQHRAGPEDPPRTPPVVTARLLTRLHLMPRRQEAETHTPKQRRPLLRRTAPGPQRAASVAKADLPVRLRPARSDKFLCPGPQLLWFGRHSTTAREAAEKGRGPGRCRSRLRVGVELTPSRERQRPGPDLSSSSRLTATHGSRAGVESSPNRPTKRGHRSSPSQRGYNSGSPRCRLPPDSRFSSTSVSNSKVLACSTIEQSASLKKARATCSR